MHRRSSSRRQASVDFPKYAPQIQQLQMPPQLQNVQVSDYESDNPAYPNDYPSRTMPTSRTKEEMNEAVVMRFYPDVTRILSVAPYAVMYEFSPIPEPTWTKSGVEGSLFICALTPGEYNEDRYMAAVLNRRGLDNWQAPLVVGDMSGVEITDQYIIVCVEEAHGQKIWGVFIWNDGPGTTTEHTRAVHGEVMQTLAHQAGVSRQQAEMNAANARAQHANGHVQEAENAVEDISPPDQTSNTLLQLFGQNRREDAGERPHPHGVDGAADMNHYQRSYQPTPVQSQPASSTQPDVLGDLFRRAGLALN